jgi:hypothetical protein
MAPERNVINEDWEVNPYRHIIGDCRELLSPEVVNHPSERFFMEIAIPGFWDVNGNIVQAQGITAVTSAVLTHPRFPGVRTAVTLTERLEEEVENFVNVSVLTITRREPTADGRWLCTQYVLFQQNTLTVPAIMYFSESGEPAAKQQEIERIVYSSDSRIAPEDAPAVSDALESAVAVRPVLLGDSITYFGSFDSATGGMKQKVIEGLLREGFTPDEFRTEAYSLLEGLHSPLCMADFDPALSKVISDIAGNSLDPVMSNFLRRDTLLMPEGGYPLYPHPDIMEKI